MGISLQRLRRGRCCPASREQPHRVPPFPLPRRRCSVHLSSYLSLVHAPPLQQRSHLQHTHQQPPATSQPIVSIPSNSIQTRCGFHLGFGLVAEVELVLDLLLSRLLVVTSAFPFDRFGNTSLPGAGFGRADVLGGPVPPFSIGVLRMSPDPLCPISRCQRNAAISPPDGSSLNPSRSPRICSTPARRGNVRQNRAPRNQSIAESIHRGINPSRPENGRLSARNNLVEIGQSRKNRHPKNHLSSPPKSPVSP